MTVCFAAGFCGAHSASVFEVRSAVAQTRAAAQEVNGELTALEESLWHADGSIRASAFAVDHHDVVEAAASVEAATTHAVTTAQQPAAALASGATPNPAASVEDSQALNALVDVDIAQVLDGEIDTPTTARNATARLNQVSEDLDAARELVDEEVRELEQARAVVKHQVALDHLDRLLERAPQQIESATEAITQVAGRVADSAVITPTTDAATAVAATLAQAQHVDRQIPDDVTANMGKLTRAMADLDVRLGGLEDSHYEWVTTKNHAITARNNAAVVAHAADVEVARHEHVQANRDQVAARSNGWSGQPTGVSGTNGRLAWDSLCELDFAPHHRLQCDAAQTLMAANLEYFAQTGNNLVLTDSYRSYSLQVRTRALKPRTAARPGTSNHGWGMAVDMDRASARWLTEHGGAYGWVHPRWARSDGSRPEWWHLEYVATDVGSFREPAPKGLMPHVVSVFAPEHSKSSAETINTGSTSPTVTRN